MTRKDFNAIAASIKQTRHDIKTSDILQDHERGDVELGLDLTMSRLIEVLKASNPNFDVHRFITATLP